MFSGDLRSKLCPNCGRKGLHYANHPHAFGYKDYDKIECRFCHARFKPKERNKVPLTIPYEDIS